MKKINKLLFFISYTLILISYTFGNVKLNPTFSYIIYLLPIIILIFLFIYQNLVTNRLKNKKTLIFLVILFILGIVSSINTDNTIFLRTFLFICAFKNIKFDDFIKCDSILRITFVIILLVLYCLNLTGPVEVYRAGGVLRYAFGFWHPNKFSLYIMLICMDFTYLFLKNPSKKIKWLLFTFISILSFIVIYFANSKASFVIMICCLILILVNKNYIYKFIEMRPIKFLIKNSVLILTVITFLLIGLYRQENVIAIKINSLLSDRLYWASIYLENYDLNLFGNEIIVLTEEQIIDGNKYFALDNSFVYFSLYYGVIIMAIIILLFGKTFKILYTEKKYIPLILLLLIVIYSSIEAVLFKFYYNPFLLLFSYTLFKDKECF